jgi:5-methylcytosine-specific restriction endonuclease McrA
MTSQPARNCQHCAASFAPRNAQHSFCCAGCRTAARRAFTKAARTAALARDNATCQSCGRPAVDVHHITPLALGGAAADLANLQSLCKPCHQDRHRSWTEAIAA